MRKKVIKATHTHTSVYRSERWVTRSSKLCIFVMAFISGGCSTKVRHEQSEKTSEINQARTSSPSSVVPNSLRFSACSKKLQWSKACEDIADLDQPRILHGILECSVNSEVLHLNYTGLLKEHWQVREGTRSTVQGNHEEQLR